MKCDSSLMGIVRLARVECDYVGRCPRLRASVVGLLLNLGHVAMFVER